MRCSALRSANAAIVAVGFMPLEVTNTLLSITANEVWARPTHGD